MVSGVILILKGDERFAVLGEYRARGNGTRRLKREETGPGAAIRTLLAWKGELHGKLMAETRRSESYRWKAGTGARQWRRAPRHTGNKQLQFIGSWTNHCLSSELAFLNRWYQTGLAPLTPGEDNGRAAMMLRVFRHFIPASVLLLALCEAMLIFIVWNFSLFSGRVVSDTRIVAGEPALVLALLAICVMALSGLYHNKAFADFRVMAIQIAIAFVALLGIVSVYDLYFQETFDNFARSAWSFAKTAVLTWLVCVLVTRIAFSKLANLDFLKRRVVVLGTGDRAARIASLAAAGDHRYFVPVTYLECAGESSITAASRVDLRDKGPDAIAAYARGVAAAEIV